jgi:hypothetical protein
MNAHSSISVIIKAAIAIGGCQQESNYRTCKLNFNPT